METLDNKTIIQILESKGLKNTGLRRNNIDLLRSYAIDNSNTNDFIIGTISRHNVNLSFSEVKELIMRGYNNDTIDLVMCCLGNRVN